MWLKFVFLEIFSLIGPIISSTLFTFGKAPLFLDRLRERETNVHRGLFLSLRPYHKNQICRQVYGSQLYIIDNMNKEKKTFYGRPYYEDVMSNWYHAYVDFFERNLTVGKTGRVVGDKWNVYIKCTSKFFGHRKPYGDEELYLSFAFKSKWLVVNRVYEKNPKHFLPSHYAVLPPDLMVLGQFAQLERLYVNIQRNIENLRKESPSYMKHIEGRDSFSNLSDWQKFVLCASVLSTRRFHEERLEFSFEWMNDILEKKKEEPLDHQIDVLFTTMDSPNLPAVQCILCKAVSDVTQKNSKRTNVYVTRAHGSSYSAFVLIEKKDGIHLHSGFENIAVLMPGHEDMNVRKMFLDIDLSKPSKPE